MEPVMGPKHQLPPGPGRRRALEQQDYEKERSMTASRST